MSMEHPFISPELLDSPSLFLPSNEDGSLGTEPMASDLSSGALMPSFTDLSKEISMSQLDQLERILGSPTIANHVDFTAPSTDLGFLADPSMTLSSAELTELFRVPSDGASLMPETTPQPSAMKGPDVQSTSPEEEAIVDKVSLTSGPAQAALAQSAEVKQLRKKYHEKYKERNRLAAGRSRQKQVDLIELLQAEQREEERRRQALEKEIAQIQKELEDMKQELQHHIRIANCMTIMSHGAHLQTLGLLAQDILR